MTQKSEPILVIHAKDISPQPSLPTLHRKQPHTMARVVQSSISIELQASDLERGLLTDKPLFEKAEAGLLRAGVGGGETWHAHQSCHEAILYILKGTGTVSWQDGGKEKNTDFSTGDFIRIAPEIRHQWLNTGKEDLTIVYFIHAHNFKRP